MAKSKQKIKVKCEVCGKEEFVTPCRAKNYHTCSTKCAGIRTKQRLSKKIKLICPICGKEYEVGQSEIQHHRTCGNKECSKKWRQQLYSGKGNPKYKQYVLENGLYKNGLNERHVEHDSSKAEYQHIVKTILGLPSVKAIPKGYHVHHKDCDHLNNNPKNLILLPQRTHMLIHRWFGNVLLQALHTGKCSRETFYSYCTEEQKLLYEQIIDLNITHQVVVKQGELLEKPEEADQQPSVYRNIYEGSTTNERVLPDNAEDSNFDTSALPIE